MNQLEDNDLINALTAATKNAMKVLTKANFTQKSIENFANNYKSEYKILKSELNIIDRPLEWLTTIISNSTGVGNSSLEYNVKVICDRLKVRQPSMMNKIKQLIDEEENNQDPRTENKQNELVENRAAQALNDTPKANTSRNIFFTSRNTQTNVDVDNHNRQFRSTLTATNEEDVFDAVDNEANKPNTPRLIEAGHRGICFNSLKERHESNKTVDLSSDEESEGRPTRYRVPLKYKKDDEMNTKMVNILSSLTDRVNNFKPSRPSRQDVRLESLKNANQNVKEWFRRFEIQTIDWSEEDRGRIVPCFFEESALNKFDQMNIFDQNKYSTIKTHLITAFTAPDHAEKCFKNFFTEKQKSDESIDDFATRLINLIREMNGVRRMAAQESLSTVFIDGVKFSIHKQLTVCDNTDFDYLVQKAKKVEKLDSVEQTVDSIKEDESINLIKRKNPINNIKSEKQARSVVSNRTETVDSGNWRMINKQSNCHLCGSESHYTKNCDRYSIVPKRNENSTTNKYQNNTPFKYQNKPRINFNLSPKRMRNNGDEVIKCNHCNKMGHSYQQCWVLNPMLKPKPKSSFINTRTFTNSKN